MPSEALGWLWRGCLGTGRPQLWTPAHSLMFNYRALLLRCFTSLSSLWISPFSLSLSLVFFSMSLSLSGPLSLSLTRPFFSPSLVSLSSLSLCSQSAFRLEKGLLWTLKFERVCACVCLRGCARACVWEGVRVCVFVCLSAHTFLFVCMTSESESIQRLNLLV